MTTSECCTACMRQVDSSGLVETDIGMICSGCIQAGSSRRKAMRNRTEDELLAIYDGFLGAPHHPPHRRGIIRALRAIERYEYSSAVEMMLASDWKQEDRDGQRDFVWELVCTFACLLASDAEAGLAELKAQQGNGSGTPNGSAVTPEEPGIAEGG